MDDIDILLSAKLDEAEKIKQQEEDLNKSNYEKINKAKNLLESMKEKHSKIISLTEERKEETNIEYKTSGKLKLKIHKMQSHRK